MCVCLCLCVCMCTPTCVCTHMHAMAHVCRSRGRFQEGAGSLLPPCSPAEPSVVVQDPEKRYWKSQLPEELLPLRGMPHLSFFPITVVTLAWSAGTVIANQPCGVYKTDVHPLVRKQTQVSLDKSQGQYSKISTNLFQCALPENMSPKPPLAHDWEFHF